MTLGCMVAIDDEYRSEEGLAGDTIHRRALEESLQLQQYSQQQVMNPGYIGQQGYYGSGGAGHTVQYQPGSMSPYGGGVGPPMSPYSGGQVHSPAGSAGGTTPIYGGSGSAAPPAQQQQYHSANNNQDGGGQAYGGGGAGGYAQAGAGAGGGYPAHHHLSQTMQQSYYNSHSPPNLHHHHHHQLAGHHYPPYRQPLPPQGSGGGAAGGAAMGVMMFGGARAPHPINSPNQNPTAASPSTSSPGAGGGQIKPDTGAAADLKGGMYEAGPMGGGGYPAAGFNNGFGSGQPRPTVSPISPHGGGRPLNMSPGGHHPANMSPHEANAGGMPHHQPPTTGGMTVPRHGPSVSPLGGAAGGALFPQMSPSSSQASSYQQYPPHVGSGGQYDFYSKTSSASSRSLQMPQQSPLGYGKEGESSAPQSYSAVGAEDAGGKISSLGGGNLEAGGDAMSAEDSNKNCEDGSAGDRREAEQNAANNNGNKDGGNGAPPPLVPKSEPLEGFNYRSGGEDDSRIDDRQDTGLRNTTVYTGLNKNHSLSNMNLANIPEVPEIPELKYEELGGGGGGGPGLHHHPHHQQQGMSPGHHSQEGDRPEDMSHGMAAYLAATGGQPADDLAKEEPYHDMAAWHMHGMDQGYHHMQYPNQQQMWANFYNSAPQEDHNGGRYPQHQAGGGPMSPHHMGSMEPGAGWWGPHGAGGTHPPPDMIPYRMGSPGVPGAPGPWAIRGPRPRGDRRGPGRPRLTPKDRSGSRSRTPSGASPFQPFPGPDGIPPDMMGSPGSGDMKRGPGRPKAIMDPNAPKVPGETTKNGNKKRYTCEVCQKRFSTAWYVRVHRRSHNGERPYVCNNCGKGFMLPNVLQVHLRKCEKNNPSGQPGATGPSPSSGATSGSGQSPNHLSGSVPSLGNSGGPPGGGFGVFPPPTSDPAGMPPSSQPQPFTPGLGGAFNQRYMTGSMTSPTMSSVPPGYMTDSGVPMSQGQTFSQPPLSSVSGGDPFGRPPGMPPSPGGGSGEQFSPQTGIYSPNDSGGGGVLPPADSELHFLANDKPRDKGGGSGAEKPPNRTPPAGIDPALYCSACDLVSDDRMAADEHQKTHRPFACDLCEKRFSQKCNLVTHQRLHTGEKPYICDVCQKRFTQKGNLDAHIKTHTKEKPHACNLCSKRFAFKSSLQTHLRNHEEGQLGQDVDEDDVETIKVHARMQHIAMSAADAGGDSVDVGYNDANSQDFGSAAIHAAVNGHRLQVPDDAEDMEEGEEENSNPAGADQSEVRKPSGPHNGSQANGPEANFINGDEHQDAKMLSCLETNFGANLHHSPQIAVGHHILESDATDLGVKDGGQSNADMAAKMVLTDGRQTIAMQ